MAGPLCGFSGGGLQGLDDHILPAEWAAQSWLIWHPHGIYVANCVRYLNDDHNTICILYFRWSRGTISGQKLQDLSLLGWPTVR